MAIWILKTTGGDFTDEGRANFISNGRAKVSDFVAAAAYAPPTAAAPPPSPPAPPGPGARFAFLFRGGEVSEEARQELLSNGAKAADFTPTGAGARFASLDFSEAPAPAAEPIPAAQYVDTRSGAVVSAAARDNLIAQGRASVGDFRAA